jgi:hypothetical protein
MKKMIQKNDEETPDWEIFKALSAFRNRPDKVLVLRTFPGMTELYKHFHRTSWVPDKYSKPKKIKELPEDLVEELNDGRSKPLKRVPMPQVGSWRWISGPYSQQEIVFTHDGYCGVDYFHFNSRATGGLEKIEALLRNAPFEYDSEDQVLQRFHAAKDEEDRLLCFRTLMLLQEDSASPEALAVSKRMLADPTARTRRRTVEAMSTLRWREARSLLEPLQDDLDKEVCEAAMSAVGNLLRLESTEEDESNGD